MCGICGIIDFTEAPANKMLIRKMTETIKHRGPDDSGVEIRGPMYFGHTRLSIIDLSAGAHQPMVSSDGKVTLIFNGEIYNFIELRQVLEKESVNFRTSSDTEVILNAYQQWGLDAIGRLNGMFALAIWDERKQTLVLARDRFGIKPLYYIPLDHGIVFASEIKALDASGYLNHTINPQALHEFMYYGVSLREKCLHEDVRKLLPGHTMVLGAKDKVVKPYWRTEQIGTVLDGNHEATTHVRTLLEEAVKTQLVADVPIGILLSGGIDSSCITAFASRHYPGKISTYSLAFDFAKGANELGKARSVAKYFNTDHHEIHISGKNQAGIIEQLVKCHDEPFADAANIPLYLTCQKLAGNPKVILQGDGGDEIFAGYRRYNLLANQKLWYSIKWIRNLIDLLGNRISKGTFRLKRLIDAIAEKDAGLRMALLLTLETRDPPPTRILSQNWRQKIQDSNPFLAYNEMNRRFIRNDLVQRMLYTDTNLVLPDVFLEKVDKSTMAHGVEVRVPMLENNLTDYVMGLPSSYKVKRGQKKWILRQALRGVVPDSILDAPKTGFEVPYGYWLRVPLADYMKSVLLDPSIEKKNLFDKKTLESCIKMHVSAEQDNGFLLWKALNLALWVNFYKIEM